MAESVTIQAPAKLNLALSVGRPREDGLHPICSWMRTITLFDEVHVTRLDADSLSRYAIDWHDEARRKSEIDWPVRDDLAVKAHYEIENQMRERLPVQVRLEKRIPVGAGLGGGSSNAAAMLRAVNDLFELKLDDDELRSIGARIGSDVPFFVTGGSGIVSGVGEEVELVEASAEVHAVLVLPEFGCATGEVYRHFTPNGDVDDRAVRKLLEASSLAADATFNDLTEAAMKVAPSLQELMQRVGGLAEQPVTLTGSGSAFFLLCDSAVHAEALAMAVEEQCGVAAVAVSGT